MIIFGYFTSYPGNFTFHENFYVFMILMNFKEFYLSSFQASIFQDFDYMIWSLENGLFRTLNTFTFHCPYNMLLLHLFNIFLTCERNVKIIESAQTISHVYLYDIISSMIWILTRPIWTILYGVFIIGPYQRTIFGCLMACLLNS